ncbi:MAG: class I SAM-dependent methyltransferase [Desulfobacteraceae bacterium]|jgi:ubiquinone/menaquinone biosynthesis C-methylase UbiE
MSEKMRYSKGDGSRLAFWIISLVHDNRLLPLVKNPCVILKNAGLEAGRQVLEVGCGPGFYTLPAAEIVGPKGHVFAVDVNSWAIQRVRQKVQQAGVHNVTPMRTNGADSGLPDQSINIAILFGLPRVAGGETNLIKELGRVIKPGGRAVFQKSRRSEKALAEAMQQAGFIFDGRQQRLLRFRRQ